MGAELLDIAGCRLAHFIFNCDPPGSLDKLAKCSPAASKWLQSLVCYGIDTTYCCLVSYCIRISDLISFFFSNATRVISTACWLISYWYSQRLGERETWQVLSHFQWFSCTFSSRQKVNYCCDRTTCSMYVCDNRNKCMCFESSSWLVILLRLRKLCTFQILLSEFGIACWPEESIERSLKFHYMIAQTC